MSEPSSALLLSGLDVSEIDIAAELATKPWQSLALKSGTTVFSSGQACQNFLLVRSGTVKVFVTAEGGRQILLYRVGPGELCILTIACLLSGASYEAEAVVENNLQAIILPKPYFNELLASSPRFRHVVFNAFGSRLHGLIALVQDVVERHVDRRLARYLSQSGPHVGLTHQQLALELGTAREVVSRLLKDFESRGWLQTARGHIAIQDQEALEHYAAAL